MCIQLYTCTIVHVYVSINISIYISTNLLTGPDGGIDRDGMRKRQTD